MDQEESNSLNQGFLNLQQPNQIINSMPTPPQKPIQPKNSPKVEMKAFRVQQMYQGLPPDVQKSFFDSSFKNKFFTGIRGLFGISTRYDESTQFLGCIDQNIFAMEDQYDNLPDLFHEDHESNTPKMQISKQLDELTEKLSQIQKKAFNLISINKTIGQAFLLHFQNFCYVKEQSNFLQFFQRSLNNFYIEANKIKTPGTGLIVMIYDFWMKMFKDFVRQIWKHSQNYTLNLFKKQKKTDNVNNEGVNCARSTTSSSQNGTDKEKRRAWSKSELELLQKIIDSNAVFSTARIQQLAKQLQRSASSITSKVAKIIKLRKSGGGNQKNQESSIESKIIYVLQNSQKSMTRQEIINAINESYEMGIDDSWKNSVSSILSSSKVFQKAKAPYRLHNPSIYYNYTFSNNFKDKVIQSLLSLPNNEGNVNQISSKYSLIFNDFSPELKTNISKTLARYDCFERESAKIFYNIAGRQGNDLQIQSFLK